MNKLFLSLDFVRTYIYNLLIRRNSFLKDNLGKVETTLAKIQAASLKTNVSKYFFAKQELEYIGHYIIQKVVIPIPKKLSVI